MSRTIDERVVSMQFDNKQFESNVKTTMSTLDRLKQSLNLSGASKGLEGVSAAASKCNLSPLSNAVESVKVKFSALEVMGVTALANITNSAVNAGKRIVESLTITPITTGFSEYELKMGSIQTIMASTGESLATVNEYLNELNKYSDQTIYSFQDMTQNIGKFTNAGVNLEDAVLAIKGIANEAALSGANANEASRAMYNFAQALSTGYVQRIDWKSIELANMATVEFKEQLLDSAVAMGTVEKNAKGMWKAVGDDKWYNTSQMFIESLDEQWLTSEVLIDTLRDYADETTDIGKRASEAATQVKTFTMLMDTLKESAQSGWAQSWETIVGDYDESKNLFTKLSETIGGFLEKSASRRNNMLSEVLDSNWEKLVKQLNEAGISTENFDKAIRGVVKSSSKTQESLAKQGKTLEDLIEEHGSLQKVFESGAISSDILLDAVNKVTDGLGEYEIALDRVLKRGTKGDDVKQMQKILKELDYDLGEFGENLDGIDGRFGPVTQAAVKLFQEKNQLKVDGIVGPETLAALEKAAEELNKTNEETKGLVQNMKDLAKNIDDLGGRQKLIKAIATLWEKLGEIFDSVKKGFENIFGDVDIAGTVVKIIDKFSDWVEQLTISEEVLGSIESIISGICAAIQTGAILGGGLFGILYKIVNTAIRFAGLDLITVLGDIGDAIVGFRQKLIDDNALGDFLDSVGTELASWLGMILGFVGKCADAIGGWIDKFREMENVKTILKGISDAYKTFKNTIGTWLEGFATIFGDFLEALNGLEKITFKNVWAECKNFWSNLVTHFGSIGNIFDPLIEGVKNLGLAFIDFLGLTEPFNDFVEWVTKAKTAFLGWANGVEEYQDLPQKIAQKIIDGFKTAFDWVVAQLQSFGTKIWNSLTGTSDGMSESGEEMGSNLVTGLAGGIWSGIKLVFQTISELCTAVITKVCEIFDINSPSKVFFAIGGFLVAGLIAGIVNAIPGLSTTLSELFGGTCEEIEEGASFVDKLKTIGTNACTVLGSIVGWIRDHFDSLAAIIGGVGIAMAAFKLTKIVDNLTEVLGAIPKGLQNMFESFGKAKEMRAKAKLVLSYAIAIGILAAALYFMAQLSWGDIGKGAAVIAGLGLILGGLTVALSKLVKSTDPMMTKNMRAAMITMVGLAASVAILAYALKIMDGFESGNIWRNLAVIGILAVGMAGLAVVMSKLAPEMTKGSLAMIGISVAVFLLVAALSKINALTIDDPKRTIGALLVLIGGLALVAMVSKGINGKAALGLVGMVIGIYLFIKVLEKLAKLDTFAIENSMGALVKIVVAFAALMFATKFAGENAKAAGRAMVSISVALLLTIFAIKLLGNMDSTVLRNGVNAITQLLLIFGLMIALSKFAGKDAAKAGVMLIAASAAILILTGALAILANVENVDGLKRATVIVSVLLTLFAGLIFVSKFAANAKGSLIAIAVTIGILVAAIGILSLLEPKELMHAVAAIATVMLVLAALIASLKFVQTAKGTCIRVVATLLILGGIIVILGYCIKQLAELDPKRALGAAGALSLVLMSLSAAVAILGKAKNITTDAAMGALLMLGIVWLIGKILQGLKDLDPKQTLATAGALSGVLIAISAACLILSKSSDFTGKGAIKAAFAMVAILIVLGVALGLMEKFDLQTNYTNAICLSLVINALATACLILSKSSDFTGKGAIKAAFSMAVVMIAIGAVLGLMCKWDLQAGYTNAICLSLVINALAAACLILSKSSDFTGKGAIKAAFSMAAVMAILALVLGIMAVFDIEVSITNAMALSTLLIAMSVVTLILSKVGPAASAAITGAAAMMGVIILVGAIAMLIGQLMSLINPEDIESWKTGLQAFMDFIVILAQGIGDAIGALIGGTLAGVGQGLSDFMTNIQGFIDGAKQIDMTVADGIKALAAAILAITGAAIIDGLSKLFGLGSMDELGASMSSFGSSMIAFAQSISTLTEEDIARIKMAAEAGQAMAQMESVIPKQGGWVQTILGSSDMADFGLRMEAFGKSLVAFSESIAELTEDDAAKITRAATAGTELAKMEKAVPKQGGWAQTIMGASDMADFGTRMVAFGDALVDFAASISSLTDADADNITMSATVGTAMAELESIIPRQGGWWQAIAGEKDLRTFGSSMVAFGDSLVKYAGAVSKLSDSAADDITNSKSAAEALVGVYGVLPKDNGWWGSIAGETDAVAFGEGMYQVARAIDKYSTVAANISDDDVDNIKTSKDAVDALKDVSNSVTGKGLFTTGAGDCENLITFATGMVSMADSLKKYSATVSEGIDVAKIEESKTAIIAMAAAAESIPNSGGVAGWLCGDNDEITIFGTNMVLFADLLMSYATKVSGFSQETVDTITFSATAMTAMANAAGAVPNSGGVGGWLFGDNDDIPTFGANMNAFADSLMSYATKVAGITEEDVTAINYSATAMSAMAWAASKVPNAGGVAGWLCGENTDIATFGVNMLSMASMLRQYIARVAGINEDNISAINLSGIAIYALAGVATKASLLNTFETAVSDLAITQLYKLLNLARSMSGVDFGPMSSFAESLGTLGASGVQQFIAAFTNSYDQVMAAGTRVAEMLCTGIRSGMLSLTNTINTVVTGMLIVIMNSEGLFKLRGVMLMTQFASGIATSVTIVTAAVSTAVSSAVTFIEAEYSDWYDTGKYLVEGFAAGITANTFMAEARATAMAQAALAAAKSVLKINSPSKVFRDIVGRSVPEGFAAGIDKFAYMVTDSTTSMASNALDGTRKAISRLADYVNTDIDTQPTIRPVLDLSDVASGASAISGMFGMTPSVGILSNVGSISSMMNQNQNGASNDDVVSAINSLKSALGSTGDTYHFDGITYDDGSNIADAVKSLVHAAKIERRV